MNSQDNLLSSEPCNPITAGPEKHNLTEAEDRGFKMAIMSMVKGLIEDANKSLNADWQHRQLDGIMKTVQDMRAETESLSQGFCCCDETPRPKKLVEGRVYLAYIAQSVERNQVRNSNRAGAWRWELMRTEALKQ